MTSETSNDHFRLCLVLSQMLLVPLLTLAQGPIAIPPERLPFGVPFQVLSTLVPETAFWFLVFHFSVAEGDTVRRCKEICCGKDLLFTPLSQHEARKSSVLFMASLRVGVGQREAVE